MSQKFALVVAVETYQAGIPPVSYAEQDAHAIAAALALHGFTGSNVEFLINARATKTTIESAVRRICGQIQTDDCLYIFYAGHGFAKNDKNFITCHDSQPHDLEHTSIALQFLFEQVRKSACQHVAFFLDNCHAGVLADGSMRDIISAMTPAEFKAFFEQSQFTIGFAACKSDERSYGVPVVKHGAWTYHLVRALTGEENDAIEKGAFVTGRSLQTFLLKHVPPFVRQNLNPKYVQTPTVFGNMTGEFLIADVSPILAARAAQKVPLANLLQLASFRGVSTGSVKSLTGWKKGHFIPTDAADGDDFVRSIGGDAPISEAKRIFARLKDIFGYKRLDAALTLGDGGASIRTPTFEMEFDISLNGKNFAEYMQRIILKSVADEISFSDPKFNQLLRREFDTVVLEFANPVKVAAVVDALEAAGYSPSYDAAVTYCEHRDSGLSLRVDEEKLSFKKPGADTPEALWKEFADYYPTFIAIPGLPSFHFT